MSQDKSILETDLQDNAKVLESFCLLPALYKDRQICLRFQLRKPWSGWNLRDDVAESLGFTPGATMGTTVGSYWDSELSADIKNLNLFASGEAAQWLIDNRISMGDVFDCKVKLFYGRIGADAKFNAIALTMTKGLQVVKRKEPIQLDASDQVLQDILGDFPE